MTRGVWVFDRATQALVPKELYQRPVAARSELPAPMLIRDTMEPTCNPVNGQLYDSKRAYERAVRAAGCTIVGNEKPRPRPEPKACTEQDVVNAIQSVEARQPSQKRRKRSGRS